MTNTKLFSIFSSFTLLSFVALSGCAADTSADPESQSDSEEEVAESEDALTGADNNGYMIVTRRDFRRCISPLCGGYFVKRVNDAKTTCADGSKQAECYVSEIQLSGIGLSAREEEEFRAAVTSGKALIKARTYKHKFGGVTLGKLKANEGWKGVTGSAADGTTYRAADNGIRCITAPCPSTTAYGLNTAEDHNVVKSILDNTAIKASAEDLNRAYAAIGTKEGLLVNGGIAIPKCVPGSNCGPMIIASEFYFKVVRREGKSCGGMVLNPLPCNADQFCQWKAGDICGAADAPGTCQYKPEVCNKLFAPVCGCDGNTYGNACMANAAGMSVSTNGACSK